MLSGTRLIRRLDGTAHPQSMSGEQLDHPQGSRSNFHAEHALNGAVAAVDASEFASGVIAEDHFCLVWPVVTDRVHVRSHESRDLYLEGTLRPAVATLLTEETGVCGSLDVLQISRLGRCELEVLHHRQTLAEFVVIGKGRNRRVDVFVLEHPLEGRRLVVPRR